MPENDFLVVVGVDGSADARTAATWAVRAAEAHGGRLLVVHAWSLPVIGGGAAQMSAVAFEPAEEAARQLLEQEVEHLRSLAPSLPIEGRLEYGSPIEVLLNAGDPDLIVVGSRGVGRVAGLILGSVSQAVVTRATCPVLVVPPADRKRA